MVADLFAQRVQVALLDRVDDLVGFLEDEMTQGLYRLLTVPRASLGRAQLADDVDETINCLEAFCAALEIV